MKKIPKITYKVKNYILCLNYVQNLEIDIIEERGYYIGMMKKKLIALFLIASFVIVAIPSVREPIWADSAEDKKKKAEDDLEKIEDEMDDIKDQQDDVATELKDVRSQLAALMDQQETLKAEIDTTQADIEQTKLDLEVAKADADEQYEAMKVRIQYMYENSTADTLWTAILQADGIADLLKRVEYVSTIHKADKELTDQYKEIVAEVEAKEEQLLVQMDEMLMKQEAYLGQQAEIEEMIASLEEDQKEFEEQLADAKELAEEYKKTIKEQEEIISRRDDDDDAGDKNASGQELVNYALQFVGNPYVWGGNSLTNGCDCSGFVHLVYKHFGYKTVRYSMSFLYEGVAVDYDDMKPGDVIVYAKKNGVGHVAIYMGNGKIVEAQSAKAGITSNRSVNCREIVGIRRILKNP